MEAEQGFLIGFVNIEVQALILIQLAVAIGCEQGLDFGWKKVLGAVAKVRLVFVPIDIHARQVKIAKVEIGVFNPAQPLDKVLGLGVARNKQGLYIGK